MHCIKRIRLFCHADLIELAVSYADSGDSMAANCIERKRYVFIHTIPALFGITVYRVTLDGVGKSRDLVRAAIRSCKRRGNFFLRSYSPGFASSTLLKSTYKGLLFNAGFSSKSAGHVVQISDFVALVLGKADCSSSAAFSSVGSSLPRLSARLRIP